MTIRDQKMDKEGQKKLMSSVETVISRANDGEDPTDALVKVATDQKHTPEEMRRIQEAYNQSKTIHDLENQGSHRKHATFTLCNADKAIEQVYPSNPITKQAGRINELAAKYSGASTKNWIKDLNKEQTLQKSANQLSKSASAEEDLTRKNTDKQRRDNYHRKIAAWHEYKKYDQEARDLSVSIQEKLASIKPALSQQMQHMPFHEFEMGLHQKYGESAGSLAALIYQAANLEKKGHRRATPNEIASSNTTMIDLGGSGKNAVEDLVKTAVEFQKKTKLAHKSKSDYDSLTNTHIKKASQDQEKRENTFQKYASDLEEARTPRSYNRNPFFKSSPLAKSAAGFTTSVLNSLWEGLEEDKESQRNTYKSELDKSISALQDPDVRDTTNQVEIQTMLNDFMYNDEIISSYEPEEVVDMFNEISSLSPQIAKEPAIMRDLLRRSLQQGTVEIAEASQAISTGQNLAESYGEDKPSSSPEAVNLEQEKARQQSGFYPEKKPRPKPAPSTPSKEQQDSLSGLGKQLDQGIDRASASSITIQEQMEKAKEERRKAREKGTESTESGQETYSIVPPKQLT